MCEYELDLCANIAVFGSCVFWGSGVFGWLFSVLVRGNL